MNIRTLEFETSISTSHQIHLTLPDTVQAKVAKVIVIYEEDDTQVVRPQRRVFGQFRGKIEISDDFDDELDTGFWLGEKNQ